MMKKIFLIFLILSVTIMKAQNIEWIITPQYYGVAEFSEGYAAVTDGLGKWGYIDCNNNLKIKYKYAVANTFENGIAKVGIKKSGINPYSQNYDYFFIDNKGEKIKYDTKIEQNQKETEPDLVLFSDNDKYGFKNRDNQIVIPAIYDAAIEFYNGYSSVSVQNKWGIIDTKGKIIIPLEFEQCGKVSENKVGIQNNGLWGFAKIK